MRIRELMSSTSEFAATPGICSIGPDDGGISSLDAGGGGGEPGSGSGVDSSSPSGFDQSSSDDDSSGDHISIDLDSTDPSVLYSQDFPRNRKLSREQIEAVMGYNPLARPDSTPAQPPAPARQPAQTRQPTQPQSIQQVETQYGILPAGYKLTQTGRILDPSNRFVAVNKVPWVKRGTQQPAARAPAPQPAPAPAPSDTQQLIAAFTQALEQRQPAAPAPAQTPQPQYMYGPGGLKPAMNIPPAIIQMLDSDDPNQRAQGITMLANGVANTVIQDVVGMMSSMRSDIVENHVPAVINRQRSENSARDAFYSRYPQLRRPELSALISQISKTVGAEWTNQGYDWRDPSDRSRPSEIFMDTVVQRYLQIVGLAELPGTQPAIQPQIQPQVGGQVVQFPQSSARGQVRTASQQPYFPSQGARPPTASPASVKSEEIRNVIFSR